MGLVVDSFAWLEFFKGGPLAEKILGILERSKGSVYTTTANFYEVYYRSSEIYGPEKRERNLAVIKANAELLYLSENMAREAGEIRLRHGLSAIDAFTLAAARIIGGKVLTGDPHFKEFAGEIVFI